MSFNRSSGRDVHFYDARSPEVPLGGMIQNGSVTEENFLDMLGILLVAQAPLRVHERTSGHAVTRTHNQLRRGKYDIHCDSHVKVSDEPWVHRLISHNISERQDPFRHGIRARDGRWVMSGVVNRRAQYGIWSGFEAAHIFPLEKESWWVQMDYGGWITDVTPGESKINSLQNGFLLRSDLHSDFDNYLVSVNPDVNVLAVSSFLFTLTGPKDNYKIIVFGLDVFGIDGRTLDFICRNPADPQRVSDNLLRWHFRQSVLANMRDAGEPIFEHDFPPGTDMMGEIREGPYAQERLEMEFASRLRRIA